MFSRFNILKKPLHRIITGGVMYAIAFFISGYLELHLSVSDICVISSDIVKAIKSLRLQLMILSLAHLFIIPRLWKVNLGQKKH